MTLTIELTPEIEQQLQQAAAREGQDSATFVQAAIEEKLRGLSTGQGFTGDGANGQPRATPQRATLEEFEAAMDELAEGSESRPVLGADAFSRENIYADHD